MSVKLGKAKYGFTQKKYFKLKDGESTFRILPPLGELADDGRWSVFYKVHYGYKNTKGKLRVFQSSLVKNKKGMIEVPDAAVQRINDLKAKLEEAKASGNKAVVERLGKLVSGQKPMYNVDSNHYLNVIDSQGNVGVLKLRHRAKQALDVQIKKLREKGIDPLSVDNGRYFTFTRSGSGLETTFQVDILQEKLKIDGVGEVNRDVVHKLSEELISRLGEEAAELGKLFRALSADEIQRIVTTSDLLTGQSPAIDELFDQRGDSGSSDEGDDGDDSTEESSDDSGAKASGIDFEAKAAEAAAKAKADAEQAAAAAKAKAEADAAAKASVAAATQAAAAKAETAPKVETLSNPTATTAESVEGMSDADFLKSLGL